MTFDHSGDDIPYVYSDVVSINFSFSVDEGAITGTGTGTHSINVTPTFEECSVQSIVAPAFEVEIEGTEDGDYFNFQIIPTSMPLTFTLHCVWDPDNPIDIPVPVYSNIEASIMGQDMFMEVLSENGASDSDSGSEGFGDDQPVDWSFSVTINSD